MSTAKKRRNDDEDDAAWLVHSVRLDLLMEEHKELNRK